MSTLDWLRKLFFPGTAAEPGPATLSFEGIAPDWAVIALIAAGLLLWWAHRRFLPSEPRSRRNLLVALRVAFLAAGLFAAARPVIVTTLTETIRPKLVVLADASASMAIADKRQTPEDQARAKRLLPKEENPTRLALLRALAGKNEIDLWPRLEERADLTFHAFGRDLAEADPELTGASGAKRFFDTLKADQPVTALGESLRQALDQYRGQPLAGIVLLTDGANNRGLDPVEAAALARSDGVPLYIYGPGVTEPRDLAAVSLEAPRIGFLDEKVNVRVLVNGAGFANQTIKITLAAEGDPAPLATTEVILPESGDVEARLSFIPKTPGEFNLVASFPALEGEASADNNKVSGRIRVIDNRLKVLMIEQEPRWDWRFLLDFLQDDRRLSLRCVLLDGDPSLQTIPDTPFLTDLPDRAELYKSDIILLGDVDPARLGPERLAMIREWVDSGGGLVFLAGPHHNPRSYLGTSLENLLPVVPAAGTPEEDAASFPEPVRLSLTPAGARSPLLRVAERDSENLAAWRGFAGVRWTARVTRTRPGADVFLVDTSPGRSGPSGPTPVLARQRFGRGDVMYFGFNETYRWRTGHGGVFYRRIWNQIFQALALERLAGASKQVQLRVDRPDYLLGERVVVAGRLYQPNFEPLRADVVPARAVLTSTDGVAPEQAISLRPVPDDPGAYRAEFTPALAGQYRFLTQLDPAAAVEFTVTEPRLEQTDAALHLRTLEGMASASEGRVFREENLRELPDLIRGNAGQVTSLRRLELAESPVLLSLLLLLACAEWLVRRMARLK